jgi:type IV secretion system protein VirB4
VLTFEQYASATFDALEVWEGCILTRTGSLIGAVESSGINPDTLSHDEVAAYTLIDALNSQPLHRNLTLWRVFAHVDGEKIALKRRSDKLCDYLSRVRQAHLNNQPLYQTRLVWFFEVHSDTSVAKMTRWAFWRGLLRNDPAAWGFFHESQLLKHQMQLLDAQRIVLKDTIAGTVARWKGFADCRPLSTQQMWAWLRFLATTDQANLTDAVNEDVPAMNIGSYLLDGDVDNVASDDPSARGVSLLRFAGPALRYGRIASFTHLPAKPKPGMLSRLPAQGNYCVITCWSPYSEHGKDWMLYRRTVQVKQGNIDMLKSFLGKYEDPVKRDDMKRRIRDKLDMIEAVENSPQVLGKFHGYAFAFGESPGEVYATSQALRKALDDVSIRHVWESWGALPSYAALIPGGSHRAPTYIDTDLGVASEAALIYAPHKGAPRVEFNGDDEPVMFFKNRMGGLLPLPPEVEGVAFNAIVGRTGAGKSLLLNALIGNGLKHGTVTVAAGIDAGNEPLATVFGKKAGLFRLDRGMNVFEPCRGHNDRLFIAHFVNLIAQCLRANEAEESRTFTAQDEHDLRTGLKAMLRRDRKHWQLSTLASYLQPCFRDKLANWLRAPDVRDNGFYADLFDNREDGPGLITRSLTVYNLMAYKDDPIAYRVILAAMFYRIRLAFESREFLDRRKHLYVDEGHSWLELPEARRFIAKGKRTGRKSRFGMTIATQSADDFANIAEWDALRSALATIIIFPDQRANLQIYRDTFGLSEGEAEVIHKMEPHKEFLLIQRDIGLSQVAIHEVEPGAEVIYTSTPEEAIRRDAVLADNLARFDIDEAMSRTYDAMKSAKPALQRVA